MSRLQTVPQEHLDALYAEGYSDLAFLGAGQFGAVYRCKNEDGVTVAVKVTLATEDNAKELLVLSQLEEMNLHSIYIVNAHRLDMYKDLFVIELDYANLPSLGLIIRPGKRHTESFTRKIIAQTLFGCVTMHGSAFAHRDIKPDNILLDYRKDTHDVVIRISDFGLAKNAKNVLRTFCGTLGFVAPEILLGTGEISTKVDVFSVGAMMYFMIFGELITGYEARERILNDPSISRECAEVLTAMLEVFPQNRPTADEVLNNLAFFRGCQEGDGVSLQELLEAGFPRTILDNVIGEEEVASILAATAPNAKQPPKPPPFPAHLRNITSLRKRNSTALTKPSAEEELKTPSYTRPIPASFSAVRGSASQPPLQPPPTKDSGLAKLRQRFSTQGDVEAEVKAAAAATPQTERQRPIPPPPLMQDDDPKVRRRVAYDFLAMSERELTVMAGQCVEIMRGDNAGWTLCRDAQGKVGYIATDYLGEEVTDDGNPLPQQSMDSYYQGQPILTTIFARMKVVTDFTVNDSVLLPVTDGEAVEVFQEDAESGWAYCRNAAGQEGYVSMLHLGETLPPAEGEMPLEEDPAPAPASDAPDATQPTALTTSQGYTMQPGYYEPVSADGEGMSQRRLVVGDCAATDLPQLNVKAGETVDVLLEQTQPGWAHVANSKGLDGVVIRKCLETLDEQSEEQS